MLQKHSWVPYFNPLPPHGGRLTFSLPHFGQFIFQSTPSAWRETPFDIDRKLTDAISIHSLRMEGDLPTVQVRRRLPYFNPLPPHGGRRPPVNTMETQCVNFNPLPPHGGRPDTLPDIVYIKDISIHSLRMEGDCVFVVIYKLMLYFNPLPPHGGRPISKS